jgi:hypothetical protein
MGVVQALISTFAQDDDRPKSIVKGNVRIAFLLKPPLYLFAVSDWGEPEHVVGLWVWATIQLMQAASTSRIHSLAHSLSRHVHTTVTRVSETKQL